MIYTIFRLIGLTLGYPLQLLFFKRKTYYEDKESTNLKKGGKLIISNHFNMWDYVLTSFVVYPRKLNVVASEHAFKNAFLRFGVKFFGAIQANRVTKNMKFIDESARVINENQLVLIYPEGRNTPDGKMHPFKPSYLVIAHRARTKIVPMVTDGSYGIFKRTSVIIGKEIDVSQFFADGTRTPSREELCRANEYVYGRMIELQNKLSELKNEKKRRKND